MKIIAFVTELNRRRRPTLRVPLPDDPEIPSTKRISHLMPAILAPTSLSVRLPVSFFQWYRRGGGFGSGRGRGPGGGFGHGPGCRC